MEFAVVGLASFLTAALTLFSGFGLGTLLFPVFALFFPVEAAVAATAVVHGANNIFKIAVVGRHADGVLVIRFGLPAVVAAFLGAAALGYLSRFGVIATYSFGSVSAEISPIKLLMGVLMFVFALFELLPALRKLQFGRRYLFFGGLLSGFFGGLSGHQGALRAAFLAKVGISTEAFVGTNAMIGFMVDVSRIVMYAIVFFFVQAGTPFDFTHWPLIATGIAAAFAGVMTGKRFLKKITMKTVQTATGIFLLGIAFFLAAGLI
ncbi:MAG: TSUP family transporter [Desulfopila sp.]|jgi:uncharacterized membrane protein YfcA|nr:TSUP family transporter [Desulfopila sp.]